jgi:cobalt-zinc-cadmium efflux system membrane fusion protein
MTTVIRRVFHTEYWAQFALGRALLPTVVVAVLLTAGAVVLALSDRRHTVGTAPSSKHAIEASSQEKGVRKYSPTAEQWAMLTVEPVTTKAFRTELYTEGKISINEDLSTPVFPPYAGRVTRLTAKPGDFVQAGQPLFFIEANDMVQAQNDFLAGLAGINKAKARVVLTEIIEKQNRRLMETKAGSMRDAQVAEADVLQAKAELRVAETTLEAARNRLRILGKTEEEISTFQEQGRISPETPIFAPISGTVVQRRIGPGQYVSYTSTGAVDPVFVIGNLATVWVVAHVRESEASRVRVGQQMEFRVPAYPDRAFPATIDYVAAAIDPATRRLLVRATVNSENFAFKPEMFASVVIFGTGNGTKVAVPRDAVIFEANAARVWVVRADRSIEMRQIKTGLVSGGAVEVLEGLQPGDHVVTKGSIFVDRAAEG